MDKIFASAPGRVFVSGEAVLELGSKALAIPAEFSGKRNVVTFSFQESSGKLTAYDGNKIGTLPTTGRIRGDESLKLPLEAAKAALLANGYSLEKVDSSFSMSLECSAPASAGKAAAVCAAVFAGIFDYFGDKDDARDAFKKEYLKAGSEISQEDVLLAASDLPLIFRKDFLLDGTISVKATATKVKLPQNTAFLYADLKKPECMSSLEISNRIASSRNVVTAAGKVKPAKDMTANERARATEGFSEITEKLCKELSSSSASPEKVASLLELEHVSLSEARVLSEATIAAASTAKQAGALAAKASGFDGALLVFAYENDAAKISGALSEKGYSALPISVSSAGMVSEREE
ncbi:MAG: hypothetical protein WC408_06925 [Candidatus Micrarchaeia archaeon]|jgi:mevalonate kinase